MSPPTHTRPPNSVVVFVRRGPNDDTNARVVSFKIPDGLDPLDLLDRGFAIDGDMASFTVYPVLVEVNGLPTFEYESTLVSQTRFSLTDALADAQKELVSFLSGKGYAPEFTK